MGVVEDRLVDGLREMLGEGIRAVLSNQNVTDVLLNDDNDGSIWVEESGKGRFDSGLRLSEERAYIALCLIATSAGRVITEEQPGLSAVLPVTGERIEGAIPPQTRRPTFSIRKPADHVFPLEAYDPEGRFIPHIKAAVAAHENIMICGGTGGGKTSLLSSMLTLPEFVQARLVIIEDQQEIVSSSADCTRLLASGDTDEARRDSMRKLVKTALRMRPDKIVLGETRDGPTTSDLLRAMSTGHPGSAFTVHADGAVEGLHAIGDLLSDIGPINHGRIVRTIRYSIFVKRQPDGTRRIVDMMRVTGWKDGEYTFDRIG